LALALTRDGLLTMVVADKHAHYILLVHSMLREIGANGELTMPSRRKTYAERIKDPATP
jgi:hypothetical protein